MAERVYTTEAIVLRRRPSGEANVLLTLLTRDLGLIEAAAQSGRREQSKLRFGLSALSHGSYSLVPGEHVFRLIGVKAEGVFGKGGAMHARQTIGRVATLLLRLLPKGELVPGLFDYLKEGFVLVEREESERRTKCIEGMLVLKVLHTLGYVPSNAEFSAFVEARLPALSLIEAFEPVKAQAIKAINEALVASGL